MKRKAKEQTYVVSQLPSSIDLLTKALTRLRKAELVALVLKLANDDRALMRELEERLQIDDLADDLVEATRRAILDATKVDMKRLNYNFSYDHAAYRTIAKNFKRFIAAGHWDEVMQLSLELMQKGSYQVECSDEGMMLDEICDCLRPVIKALPGSDVSVQNLHRWCVSMLTADRIGFVCTQELTELADELSKT